MHALTLFLYFLHYIKIGGNHMGNYLVRELLHYCNIFTPECSKISRHTIPYFDFTYVLEGSMVYHVNGRRVQLSRGDAIFLPPGTLRARDAGGAVRYVSFNFHLMDGVTLPFDTYMPGCITPDIRRLFTLFSAQHLSPKFHATQKCANLLNFVLFELLDARALESHNPHVRKIISHIEENEGARITLSEMSRLVGLTPEYTATVFKRETGKTLGEYVNERKLLQAKGMICNSTLSLGEIAARLGFENYHYFSRLFKAHFHTTPIAMRKSAK